MTPALAPTSFPGLAAAIPGRTIEIQRGIRNPLLNALSF
jgi:hypothetical protein